MVQPTADSIEGKSSDDLKQMLMQTSGPESGEETETEEQEVTEPEETEEETKETETEESETKEPVKSKEETGEPRYKLKVEGKEEELPLPKVLEYAQKGRYLEREIKKLKEERKRLKGQSPTSAQAPFSAPEKANEWFIEEVQKNPVPTLCRLHSKTTDLQTRSPGCWRTRYSTTSVSTWCWFWIITT